MHCIILLTRLSMNWFSTFLHIHVYMYYNHSFLFYIHLFQNVVSINMMYRYVYVIQITIVINPLLATYAYCLLIFFQFPVHGFCPPVVTPWWRHRRSSRGPVVYTTHVIASVSGIIDTPPTLIRSVVDLHHMVSLICSTYVVHMWYFYVIHM